MRNLENIVCKGLTEKQASQRWPYSIAWFQRKRHEGGGPPYRKVGGRVIYPIEQLDAWFESHALVTSTSEELSNAE